MPCGAVRMLSGILMSTTKPAHRLFDRLCCPGKPIAAFLSRLDAGCSNLHVGSDQVQVSNCQGLHRRLQQASTETSAGRMLGGKSQYAGLQRVVGVCGSLRKETLLMGTTRCLPVVTSFSVTCL
jgi:hypothetical protein